MTWLAMSVADRRLRKAFLDGDQRLVFLTEAMTVSRSIGRMVRRSMISASMPILASSASALSA